MKILVFTHGTIVMHGEGGEVEMASPHLSAEARARIKAIVVPEFGGIDHLPDDPGQLLSWPDTGEGAP